jgi:hypothetical protein
MQKGSALPTIPPIGGLNDERARISAACHCAAVPEGTGAGVGPVCVRGLRVRTEVPHVLILPKQSRDDVLASRPSHPHKLRALRGLGHASKTQKAVVVVLVKDTGCQPLID